MVDDESLVRRVLNGDVGAFSEIVERYQGQVYNLAYRMLGNPHDAEDAAQEAFLRCYSQLGSYDSGRKFSTWLLSITSHLCIDLLRRRRFTWLSWDDASYDRSGAPEEEPESVAMRLETRREFQKVLQAMSPKYRLVTILRYWHDLSFHEIAEATGLSESAVKTRLFRAREWLARNVLPTGTGGGAPGRAEDAPAVEVEGACGSENTADGVQRRCGVVMLNV